MLLGIVQARVGSKRFPGKVMAKLGEYRVIDWVLSRVQQSQLLRAVILAIPDTPENDELASMMRRTPYYVDVVRGPEEDVLTRFVQAAKRFDADHLVRICADNPFIDPDEIDKLVGFYFYKRPDYSSNNNPRWGFSDSFGAEIFNMKTLKLFDERTHDSEREHVTSYVTRHITDASEIYADLPKVTDGLSNQLPNFDIDIPEDLKRLNQLPVKLDSTAHEIVMMAKQIW